MSALRNSTADGDANLIVESLVLWILGSLALWSSLYPFWLVLHCEKPCPACIDRLSAAWSDVLQIAPVWRHSGLAEEAICASHQTSA